MPEPQGPQGGLQIGQLIGNYRVVRKLGEGGMGAVFESVHVEIGRRAAVKVLHPQLSQNPEIANRFLNEARAVNIVAHVGLVGIFEYGRLPDSSAYIIMEYLEGDSLQARLARSGTLALADVLRLGRQVASALAAAHKKGVVHRDLKPDNVMIVPDSEAAAGERAKVLDFGIAKVTADGLDHQKTRTGMMMGTPTYMSPEQCRGSGTLDGRTDVYALGVMLYQCLAGRPPFVAEGMGELLAMHMFTEPQPLRQLAPGVPESMALLVHAMLAKDAAGRPSMDEVVTELERLGAARTETLHAFDDREGAGGLDGTLASVPAGAQGSQPPARSSQVSQRPASPTASSQPARSAPPQAAQRPATLALPPEPHGSTLNQALGQTPTAPPGGGRGKLVLGGVGLAVAALVAVGLFIFTQRSASTRPLVVAVARTGAGTITSSPPGIECGSRCRAEFPPGTVLSLRAAPDDKATFAGWSGACTGTGGCGLVVNHEAQVAARFDAAAAERICKDGFCLSRAPAGHILFSLWGATRRDIWAVGDGGVILHYDGERWREANSGTDSTLHDVYGRGPADVWAVGDGGTIVHYDGSAWSKVPGGTQSGLYGVWGAEGPGGDLWAVGQLGTMLHHDGRAFGPVATPKTGATLLSVWGSGPRDVWAAGQSGALLHWDGRKARAVDSRTPRTLTGLSGTGPADIWAVGQVGTVLHYDGRRWSKVPSGSGSLLTSVFARRPGEVYVTGEFATLLRGNGVSFQAIHTPASATLTRSFASRAGPLWVVGHDATLLGAQ